ncbi:antitoxin MazE family protein [Microlunatus elymi]|nr:antitoxin MazE family protein [Microlunatus elymi]
MGTSTERVRQHRERLRHRGMRPVQIWIPDVNAPGFAEEAHRQAMNIRNSPAEAEDQAWMEAMVAEVWDGE